MSKLKAYKFDRIGILTVASEIENFANSRGAAVLIDPNGARHPGTVCNQHLRSILSDISASRVFRLKKSDVVQLDTSAGIFSHRFYKYLLEQKLISPQSVKDNKLDLYSLNAAELIIRSILNDPDFDLEDVEIKDMNYAISATPKDMTPLKYRPQKSLLVPRASSFKVIDEFTDEEQEVIRRYNKRVKETREKGNRKYTKRNQTKLEDK